MNNIKNFLKNNDFHEPLSFDKVESMDEKINKDGFGVFIVFSSKPKKELVSDLNQSLFPLQSPKMSFEVAKDKLLISSNILLFGIPHFLYNTKHLLINEVIELYNTGKRFPKRHFFGKLLFSLRSFHSLKVSWKFCDYSMGVESYLQYLKSHEKKFNSLPFANTSSKRPRRPFNVPS